VDDGNLDDDGTVGVRSGQGPLLIRHRPHDSFFRFTADQRKISFSKKALICVDRILRIIANISRPYIRHYVMIKILDSIY